MESEFFEGREVKPYGEYVLGADLVIGRVYFRVGYLDEDMAVPEMNAFVFLGRDLSSRLPGLYFQDAASYLAGERLDAEDFVTADDTADADADGRHWVREDDVVLRWQKHRKHGDVYEFEGALNTLLGCSLRRKKWDGTLRSHDADDETETK